jgi:hypothetical protein
MPRIQHAADVGRHAWENRGAHVPRERAVCGCVSAREREEKREGREENR